MVVRCTCGYAFWLQSIRGERATVVEFGDLNRDSATYRQIVTACPRCRVVLTEDNTRVDQAMTDAELANRYAGGPCCPGILPVRPRPPRREEPT
jgi:hypothetical protein